MRSRRKNTHEKEPNLERWLVSYADFITLLFAVFVTLYAMSIVDKKKVEQVQASILSSFGIAANAASPVNVVDSSQLAPLPSSPAETAGETAGSESPYAEGEEFDRIKKEILDRLTADGARNEVKITVNERGLVISLKEAGFFASGSASMQPEALPVLHEIAKAIKGYANTFRVEGHTDNVPVRNQEFLSNWELSTTRALTIVHYLVDRQNLPPDRLSVAGYGEYRPIADNATAEGRRKNRRVDIVMLSREGSQGEPRQRSEP